MAKMKIFEIARSMQHQDKNIKSGDLIKFLNDNGFDVKGPNSNIEDDAIAFLMKGFSKKQVTAEKTEKEEKAKTISEPVSKTTEKEPKKKEEPEKKEEPKKNQPEKEEKKEPVKEPVKENKEMTEEKTVVPEKKQNEEKKTAQKQERRDNRNNRGGRDSQPARGKKPNNGERRNNGGNGNNRGGNAGNNRNGNGGNGNNRGSNRGGNGNNRGGNGNNRGGERVLERFEKAQNGFDGIKQEQKNSRKRNNKRDDKAKQGGYRKSSKEEMSRIRSKKDPNRKGAFIKPEPVKQEPEEDIKQIVIPETLTIRALAEKMKMPAAALVKQLFLRGQMVSLNQF